MLLNKSADPTEKMAGQGQFLQASHSQKQGLTLPFFLERQGNSRVFFHFWPGKCQRGAFRAPAFFCQAKQEGRAIAGFSHFGPAKASKSQSKAPILVAKNPRGAGFALPFFSQGESCAMQL